MKTETIVSFIALLGLLSGIVTAAPLGTAFTYQGKLTEGGAPAQGIYDLRFTIYDAASGGSAVAGPITNIAAGVTNGLFTVALDIGLSVFSGQARWLEIAARTNGAGAFATFPARQPLTASPYALYASSAGTATLADNVTSNAVTASSIAGGQVVKSLNGLQDAITLAAGANVTLATNGNTLQISTGTNGSGGTALAGYRENGPFAAAPLAAGNNAIAQGEGAQALGNNSVVGGGLNNLASQWFTTVGGGWSNIAGGFLFGRTTISGGEWNQAQGDWSTVGGGQLNTAGGPLWGRATVAGGWQNQAGGDMSTIAGGSQNTALGGHGFIGGGQSNTITTVQAPWSTIGGGHLNQISGMAGTVGGGYQNTASATGGVVGGGENNAASGLDATVGGGSVNLASGYASVVGGGELNAATNVHTTVAGGNRNQAYGDTSTVSGGNVNLASGYASLVGGGELNAATNAHTTVAGGNRNKAFGDASTVSGGNVNLASGSMATVGGGAQNTAGGTSSTVAGGYNNRASGDYSFAAGQSAVASAQGSLVFADSQAGDFVSSLANEFAIRAFNGVRVQSEVGIHLNAVNRPLIVRDWDPFNSSAPGGKASIGRWGLFMEPDALVIGIPNSGVGYRWMEVARYNPDGSRDKVFSVGNDGVTTVKVLTITGGSDLAEPFAMTDGRIPAGSVVVIDDENPGQLKLSDHPYDHRVAGIVSGANGINPGIALHQEGALDGDQNVALTGRVYARADAANSPIRPGDLLTTSAAPGHAMKATDLARAQGAILGKAMSSLQNGRGLVLVLVTLQ